MEVKEEGGREGGRGEQICESRKGVRGASKKVTTVLFHPPSRTASPPGPSWWYLPCARASTPTSPHRDDQW